MTSHMASLPGACRVFHEHHDEWVQVATEPMLDDWMRAHAEDCPVCARFDIRVRRGLMVLRALPALEPSPALRAALAARFTPRGGRWRPR